MKRENLTESDRAICTKTLWRVSKVAAGPLLAAVAAMSFAGAASAQVVVQQGGTGVPAIQYRPGAISNPGVGVLTPNSTVNGVQVGMRPGAVIAPQTTINTPVNRPYSPYYGYGGYYGYSGYYGGYSGYSGYYPVAGGYGYYGSYSSYPAYGGYVAYPGNTVVVSPGYGAYPAGGYPATQGAGGVAVSSDAASTTVTLGGGTQITVFNGYAPASVPGTTLLSPYGGLYGGLPYIRSSSALQGVSYSYASGVEVAPVPVDSTGTVSVAAGYGDDTWLSSNVHRSADLRAAIADVQRFWEMGDATSLQRRIDPATPVAVMHGGRYAYSLDRKSLMALSEDARSRAATVSFEVTGVRRRSDGLVNVYARHLYRRSGDSVSRALRAADIESTLIWTDGAWHLSALSVTPEAAG